MKNFRLVLHLVMVVSFVFLFCSCASSGDASSSNYDKSTPMADVVKTSVQNQSTSNDESTESQPSPDRAGYSKTVTYDFEESLNSWDVSTWDTGTHGELAFTKASLSTDQKTSGSSSVALYCNFKGMLNNSKYAQGSFKINFEPPVNLKGKILSANIYIPEELISSELKVSSYGIKMYIKTGLDYIWSDGGFNDIANELKPGWNQITFSPVDANESETREIGIQMTKGDTSTDWSGTIYIDDISY